MLITGMLNVNPDKRSTVDEVLNSPWVMVWSVADADIFIHHRYIICFTFCRKYGFLGDLICSDRCWYQYLCLSVCLSVCLSSWHRGKPSKSSWTDWDTVRGVDSSGTCPSFRSPGCNRSRTLLHLLLSKLPNSVTPLPSSGLYTG